MNLFERNLKHYSFFSSDSCGSVQGGVLDYLTFIAITSQIVIRKFFGPMKIMKIDNKAFDDFHL